MYVSCFVRVARMGTVPWFRCERKNIYRVVRNIQKLSAWIWNASLQCPCSFSEVDAELSNCSSSYIYI